MTDYYALGKMDAHGVAPLKEAAARALLAVRIWIWFPVVS